MHSKAQIEFDFYYYGFRIRAYRCPGCEKGGYVAMMWDRHGSFMRTACQPALIDAHHYAVAMIDREFSNQDEHDV